jgi:hypothetical protein
MPGQMRLTARVGHPSRSRSTASGSVVILRSNMVGQPPARETGLLACQT